MSLDQIKFKFVCDPDEVVCRLQSHIQFTFKTIPPLQRIHPFWWIIQASPTYLLLVVLLFLLLLHLLYLPHLLHFITALRMSEYHPLHLSPHSPHQGSFASIQLTAKKGNVLRLFTKGLIVSISGKTETTLDLGITMTLDMIAMYQ